jgi:hypothetical protein
MLVSTILNLFFIPVLYVLAKTVLEKFGGSGPSAAPKPVVESPSH